MSPRPLLDEAGARRSVTGQAGWETAKRLKWGGTQGKGQMEIVAYRASEEVVFWGELPESTPQPEKAQIRLANIIVEGKRRSGYPPQLISCLMEKN